MNNKEIRKKRIITYFIEAADEIIEEEGIDKITIRKVAKKAGYNSATIYNYFENLDHLILFAAMGYIRNYTLALPEYLKDSKNAMDRFFKVWKCFCHFSFKEPDIYYAVFLADLDKDLKEYIKDYYKLFPEELEPQSEEISVMLQKHNIYERGMITILDCIKEGFISKKDANTLNEMGTYIYKGVLMDLIKGKVNYEEAVEKTMKYIGIIVDSISLKKFDKPVNK